MEFISEGHYRIDSFISDKLEHCLQLAANSDGKWTLAQYERKCRDILIGNEKGMLIDDDAAIMKGGSILDCIHTDVGKIADI